MTYLLLKSPFFVDRKPNHQARNITDNGKQYIKREHPHEDIVEARIIVGNQVKLTKRYIHKIADTEGCGAYNAKLDKFF